eukprot:scaffold101678_cov47-Phaeocystis_antarctica.AAC.2
MRMITLPARPAGPRWWRLAHARGGAAPRGRPDDRWIDDTSCVARVIHNYLSIYRPDEHTPLGPRLARTCVHHLPPPPTVAVAAHTVPGGPPGGVRSPLGLGWGCGAGWARTSGLRQLGPGSGLGG